METLILLKFEVYQFHQFFLKMILSLRYQLYQMIFLQEYTVNIFDQIHILVNPYIILCRHNLEHIFGLGGIPAQSPITLGTVE